MLRIWTSVFAIMSVLISATLAAQPVIAIYGGSNNETQVRGPEVGIDVFYPSITWYEPNPWMSGATAMAQEKGIKVYPSLASAYDGYGDQHHAFAAANPDFWERRRDGTIQNKGDSVSLSWGHPQVRAHKVEAFTRIVKETGVDGILLDYTRFFGNDSGYSPVIVDAFKKQHRRDPFQIPDDDPQWVQFRADLVTAFVRELRQSLDKLERDVELIACVNPDPQRCKRESLQDWGEWLEQGLIDGVTVMIYERDTNNTIAQLQTAREAIGGRVPLIAMLAPEYDNLPTPELILEGSRKALQAGADGVAYYHEGSVIRLNLWDAIGQVAQWDAAAVRDEPVNYLLNSGFEQAFQAWAIGYGNGVKIVDRQDNGRALRLDLPAADGARQIVDRGFISDGDTVRVSGRAKLESTDPAQLIVDITLAFNKAKEMRYQTPVELNPSGDWQDVGAAVHLPDGKDIKFIYLAIRPAKGSGHVLLDDLNLNIIDGDAPVGQFLTRSNAPPIKSGENVNIVRGQVVRGTSFWENGFEYDNAVDGDLGTADYGRGAAWHSQRPAKDQSITIYLPDVHVITRIRLLNASAQSAYRTDEYAIEVSTDDHAYRKVASGRLPDDGTTWTEIVIPPTRAKYIRYTGVRGFNLPYTVGLKEIEVYE